MTWSTFIISAALMSVAEDGIYRNWIHIFTYRIWSLTMYYVTLVVICYTSFLNCTLVIIGNICKISKRFVCGTLNILWNVSNLIDIMWMSTLSKAYFSAHSLQIYLILRSKICTMENVSKASHIKHPNTTPSHVFTIKQKMQQRRSIYINACMVILL